MSDLERRAEEGAEFLHKLAMSHSNPKSRAQVEGWATALEQLLSENRQVCAELERTRKERREWCDGFHLSRAERDAALLRADAVEEQLREEHVLNEQLRQQIHVGDSALSEVASLRQDLDRISAEREAWKRDRREVLNLIDTLENCFPEELEQARRILAESAMTCPTCLGKGYIEAGLPPRITFEDMHPELVADIGSDVVLRRVRLDEHLRDHGVTLIPSMYVAADEVHWSFHVNGVKAGNHQ